MADSHCITKLRELFPFVAVPLEIRARGPLALAIYLNALSDGKACVKRVPLMIVGQDRSGKTSVKNSLKGICFNPDEDSTLGIEIDRYQFKVTTEIWKTGEKDEEANIDTRVLSFEHNAARWIADELTMHEKIAEVKRTSFAESACYDFEKFDTSEESEPNETSSYVDLLEPSRNSASTNITNDEPHLLTRGEVRNPTELEPDEDLLTNTLEKLPDFDDVAKLLPQLLRDSWEDDKEDIYSMIWDFAGQSVYYVTHPLFLTRRAIYFLVYDLSRNPRDKATSLVKQGVYRKIEDKCNLKTNLDYLDFWMSSLAALGSDCQQKDPEKLEPLKKFPAVFLVCTHADQPYRDTGRVPPGLFPRLVLEFFQWCRKEFPGVDLPKTYNNFARFYIVPNQGLSLVLLCHSSTIEVVVLSVKSAIDVADVNSIRAFRNQLTSIIDRVWKKFFWVKNVGCEVCFLCPVCSHGRVASFCLQHNEESCEQEECLHFISESDLGDEKQAVCTNSATALDIRIHVEQFAPWISSSKEKVRESFFSWHE